MTLLAAGSVMVVRLVAAAGLLTVAVGLVAPSAAAQGELVDLGDGRRMYLECAGEGGPTVIFESGYGNSGEVWKASGVFEAVAASTRACVYDRPGTVWEDAFAQSDPAPMPRTAEDAATDLHALLEAADIPGPYVFVAHSLGGIFVRLYASTYPDLVAGMVLVDTTTVNQIERLRPLTPPQFQDLLFATESPPADVLAAYPDLERIRLVESLDQLRQAQARSPLRPMPLVVLTHGIPLGQDAAAPLPLGFPADAWEAAAQELQRELAALVPGGRQIIATHSGHYIQLSEPQLVIDAARSAVDEARAARIPTRIDAGTGGDAAKRDRDELPLVGLGVVLVALAGATLLVQHRREARRLRGDMA